MLETERLIIQPYSNSFLEEYYKEFTDEITKYQYPDSFSNINTANEIVSGFVKDMEQGNMLELVILTQEGEFIGSMEAFGIKEKTPEIGLWLKRSAHGKGYGYEALKGLLDHLNATGKYQKRILEKYCRDHGYTAIRHYDEDDGYSGTNFNRPGFQRMLADIKAGKIKRVVVKDMSRFGRNYLQVGMYTEMLFPEYGVHFIAVNDGVDSVRGDSEFTAIRNVFNEMYAKDTSKKIRATWQSKGRSGEHLTTIPPYGYKKDPENKKRWIVDEEAAAVVQKIFALCMDGMGPTQIAKWLQENKVLSPVA